MPGDSVRRASSWSPKLRRSGITYRLYFRKPQMPMPPMLPNDFIVVFLSNVHNFEKPCI